MQKNHNKLLLGANLHCALVCLRAGCYIVKTQKNPAYCFMNAYNVLQLISMEAMHAQSIIYKNYFIREEIVPNL